MKKEQIEKLLDEKIQLRKEIQDISIALRYGSTWTPTLQDEKAAKLNRLHEIDKEIEQLETRKCSIDNETLNVVIDNCKEFLETRNTIYIADVCTLLEKALEGVRDKKDLSDGEQEDIKRIRDMIKGL